MSASSAFDIEKFMNRSGCIDLSDINWDDVKKYPITPEAIRALKVFMNVEGATFFYLKALLRTRAAVEEPDFAPFMSAWVYEEEYHGRAFRRFIEATGEHVPDSYRADMFNQRTSNEMFTELMQFLLSVGFSEDWPAVHMAWGAVQECTTYQCYVALEKRVNHPVLSKICQRIAKQELKHFAFYFNQAKRRLTGRPSAQRLTRFALQNAWTPVGDGMMPRPEIVHTIRFLFDGYDGPQVGNIERKIQELPGLEGFDRFTHYCRQHAVNAAPAHWFPTAAPLAEDAAAAAE